MCLYFRGASFKQAVCRGLGHNGTRQLQELPGHSSTCLDYEMETHHLHLVRLCLNNAGTINPLLCQNYFSRKQYSIICLGFWSCILFSVWWTWATQLTSMLLVWSVQICFHKEIQAEWKFINIVLDIDFQGKK